MTKSLIFADGAKVRTILGREKNVGENVARVGIRGIIFAESFVTREREKNNFRGNFSVRNIRNSDSGKFHFAGR